MVTQYIVQSFQAGKKGMLIPDQPLHANDHAHCERLAAKLSERGRIAVGIARTGEPDAGTWFETVIIAQYGDLPDEVLEGQF